ncbi:MAG TPA: nucleoside deaminase [Polyangiaceae bacterium]|nr:nucleoside deaminase [Polyangiaceae bacterium]
MSESDRVNPTSTSESADPCEEQDRLWMLLALQEADLAPLHGDVPVGCVVVDAQGVELSRDHNRREERADPTAHAELLALRSAAAKLGHWRLERATVFVTLEPCAMCAGALVNARVGRVVYGATDPKAGAVHSLFEIGRDLRLNHRFEVSPGVLAEDGAARLKAFFAKLRAASSG